MTLPNFISLARLFSVPLIVWLLISEQYTAAMILFLIAGLSDAVDGLIAKRFDSSSDLGSYLDPLADKALLVSVFLTFGFSGILPPWLIILVVSRDILIIGAVILSWGLSHPVAMRPLWVSKANTTAQIVLIATVLLVLSVFPSLNFAIWPAIIVTGILTALSAAAYLREWMHHMTGSGAPPQFVVRNDGETPAGTEPDQNENGDHTR